jgi:hypothetical protein
VSSDQASIDIGIQLWKDHPYGLTIDNVRQAIVDNKEKLDRKEIAKDVVDVKVIAEGNSTKEVNVYSDGSQKIVSETYHGYP